jgi:hypothetical protein
MLAGAKRSSWMYNEMSATPFSSFHESLFPIITTFIIAGLGILVGLLLVCLPLLKGFILEVRSQKSEVRRPKLEDLIPNNQ